MVGAQLEGFDCGGAESGSDFMVMEGDEYLSSPIVTSKISPVSTEYYGYYRNCMGLH